MSDPASRTGGKIAVTRRTLDGRNPDGWIPEQKGTVEEGSDVTIFDGKVIYERKSP